MQSTFEKNLNNGMYFFETMLVIDGVVQHRDLHLRRVLKTINFLSVPNSVEGVSTKEWFNSFLAKLIPENGTKRLRVDFIFDGTCFKVRSTTSDLSSYPETFNLAFDSRAIRHSKDPFWQYKFAGWQRNLFFLQNLPQGTDDIIFINENDEVCETTRANIYLRNKDRLLTPPLESGVLNGVYRAHLLELGEVSIQGRKYIVEEEVIKRPMITQESALFISNGLMGLREARLI